VEWTNPIAFLNVLHIRFLENETNICTHKYSAYLLSEKYHTFHCRVLHTKHTHFRNDMDVFYRKTRQFHKRTIAYSCNFV